MEKIVLNAGDDGILSVKVRANASKTFVKEKMSDGSYKIDVAAVPEDNKANLELIRLLAKEFKVTKSDVEILSGQTSSKKILKIHL